MSLGKKQDIVDTTKYEILLHIKEILQLLDKLEVKNKITTNEVYDGKK